MRKINKGRPPPSLLAYRKTKHSNYRDYPNKDALRRALVTEQHGLCCYCMDRISPDRGSMKIEHWKSQSRYPERQLEYRNLLGACLGGEPSKSKKLQHCDTSKGDCDLMWNPAEGAHQIEDRIWYDRDGSIRSDDANFDRELNIVLNLNLPFLKSNRKKQLDAVLQWWRREKGKIRNNGRVPRDRFEKKRDKYLNGNGDLLPYCQVAVWWLNQKR